MIAAVRESPSALAPTGPPDLQKIWSNHTAPREAFPISSFRIERRPRWRVLAKPVSLANQSRAPSGRIHRPLEHVEPQPPARTAMQLGTPRDALRPIVRLVNKFLLFIVPGAGGFGGYMLSDVLFPRNDTAQMVAAGIGIALGVLIIWPVRRWLFNKFDPPQAA